MIVEVEAKFSCDDCGTEFNLGLDPAYSPPNGWSVFDIAEDAIRAGRQYSDGTGVTGGLGGVDSDGRHYCNSCNAKRGPVDCLKTFDCNAGDHSDCCPAR